MAINGALPYYIRIRLKWWYIKQCGLYIVEKYIAFSDK